MPGKAVTIAAGDSTDPQHKGNHNQHGGHGGHNGGGGGGGMIPFKISGKQASRSGFATTTATLTASTTSTQMISIQPSGFVRFLNLEVTLTPTGGTPSFAADGPWNVFAAVELRNAAGNDLIPPVTGYQLYLMNKYGSQFATGPYADPKNNRQYSSTAGAAHFFLAIPLELDNKTGYGSIPSLAANRTYLLSLTFGSIATVYSPTTPPTSVAVTVNCTSYYWAEPPSHGPHGMRQATHPNGVGTTAQWQIEQPSVNPGDRKIKSNNVGNLIRCLIFTIRNSSGVRIDTNGVPNLSELYVDNAPLMYLTNTEWEYLMAAVWYGFTAATKDTAGGLDTGVYVIPFFTFTEGLAGIGDGHRGQYLQTLDSTLLELRGSSWGSAISGIDILTQAVVPSGDKEEAGGAVAAFYGHALQHH